MRLLIAGLAALAAVSFAAPAFAQDDPSATPTPTPKAKSSTSCQSQKSASARNACLKKAQASTPKAAPSTTSKKAKKTTTTPATTPATAKQPETSHRLDPAVVRRNGRHSAAAAEDHLAFAAGGVEFALPTEGATCRLILLP